MSLIKRLISLLLIALPFISSGQQEVHDTLWLKNGQMVYGEFKSLDIGIITFNAAVLGEVKVKHYEVATFRATKNFYRTRLLFSEEKFGWIFPADTGNVIIFDLLDTVTVQLNQLAYIMRLQKHFIRRWSGLIHAGMSYTRSSDILRYNADAEVNYKGEKVFMNFRGNTILTGESGDVIREREELGFQFDQLLSENWSAFVSTQYQRNQTLGLRYRYQTGLGLNYQGYLSNQMRFIIGVGAVYNTELNFEGVGVESVEAPVKLSYRFKNYRDPNLSITLTQNVYFGITQQGRIRHDGEVRMAYEIINNLSLTVSFYDNYDSQSPATGESLLDYGVVSGITYSL